MQDSRERSAASGEQRLLFMTLVGHASHSIVRLPCSFRELDAGNLQGGTLPRGQVPATARDFQLDSPGAVTVRMFRLPSCACYEQRATLSRLRMACIMKPSSCPSYCMSCERATVVQDMDAAVPQVVPKPTRDG